MEFHFWVGCGRGDICDITLKSVSCGVTGKKYMSIFCVGTLLNVVSLDVCVLGQRQVMSPQAVHCIQVLSLTYKR